MYKPNVQFSARQTDILKNWLSPVLVFIIALITRLVVTFEFNQSSPFFNYPLIDAMEYDRLARILAETGRWDQPGAFYQPPLYPLFLAGIYKIFGSSYLWPRIIQSFLGASSCLVVTIIGNRFAGKFVGFLAGIICAFYGPLIYFELELLAPVLTILLSLLGLALLYRGLAERKLWLFFVSGILTGLATITWPLTGLFACSGVLAVFIKFKKNLKHSFLFSIATIIGTILPIVPVTSFNLIKGEPVLISSNGPVTFYAANNTDWQSNVLFRPGYDWEKIVTLPYRLYSEEEVNKIGKTRIFLKETANYIKEHPWYYVKSVMIKTSHLVSGFEIMNPTDLYFFKQFSLFLDKLVFQNKYLKFPFGILLPLAIIGIFFGVKHKKGYNFLFLSYLLFGSFGLVLFCVSARFRLIIIPILALYAALGTQELSKTIISKTRVSIFVMVFLLAICSYSFANIDIFKQQYFFESPIVKSQSYFAMGDVMIKQRRYQEALPWLIKAVEIDNNYSDAWIELGRTKWLLGDNIGAIVAWSKANEVAPDYPLPLFNLARIYDKSRKYDSSGKAAIKAIYFYKEYLIKAESYHEALLHRRERMAFADMRLKALTSDK